MKLFGGRGNLVGVCLNFVFPSNVAQIRQCWEMVDHLGGEYGQRFDYFFTFPDQGQSTAQLVGIPELDLCSKHIVCLDPYRKLCLSVNKQRQHLLKAELIPLELYMWCMISFTDCGTNCCELQASEVRSSMYLGMLGRIVARLILSALPCTSCERSEKEFACLCVVVGVSA